MSRLILLQSLPLIVERKLDAISIPVYPTNSDAIKGTRAVTKERTLCPGEAGTQRAQHGHVRPQPTANASAMSGRKFFMPSVSC
jgi:hypothetical protein